MSWTPAICRLALFGLVFASPAAMADDDLEQVLNDIPEIPNAEKSTEEEAEAAPPEEAEAALPAYSKATRRAVLSVWEPKAKTVKKNPAAKAQFLVKIDVNGQMTAVSAVELSGIKSFDQSVLTAIYNATFEAPPPHILSDVERGVVVTITSRSYKN